MHWLAFRVSSYESSCKDQMPDRHYRLYELQSFLVELVSHFEFAPAIERNRVSRVPCLVMTPAVDGDLGKGAQMPLKVTLTSNA